MAIKFLSGLNLSNVTAGSILKLDSNGNIVAAVDGTDYNTGSADSWSDVGSDIYRNSDVRIGTYQSGVAPAARLHVFDYQTTDPKLLIEDGNTGDASMQFKISTQQYTMGIDNSDSDKFVLAASTALGTTNVLEVATNGSAAFQKQVLFNETINLPGDGTTSSREVLINAHGNRGKLMKEGNATYWQVAQGGNQFEITDAANGNDTKGNVMLRVHGNDANDNEIYLAVNGGKVGVGTTDPTGVLHVAGTFGRWKVNGYGGMYFNNDSDTNNTRYIHARSDGALSIGRGLTASLTGAAPNEYFATSFDQLYIKSDGKVGIGTTSPAHMLDVNGNISGSVIYSRLLEINPASTGNGMSISQNVEGFQYNAEESSADAARYWLRFNYTNGSSYPYLTNRTPSGDVAIFTGIANGGGENEHFRIKGGDGTVDAYFTNANVGIGTTSPSYKLDVAGDIRSTGGNLRLEGVFPRIYLTDTDNNSDYSIFNGNGTLRIYDDTNSADRFAIDSTGNIGIGTTSPNAKLHVSDSGSATSVFIGNTGSGVSRAYLDASNGDFSGSDYMWIGQNNDLSGEIVMTASAGSFHIKTQPSGTITSQLSVSQNGTITLGSYGAGILKTNASGVVSLDTNTYSTATGVEDNADVTDATNVAAAGALMKAGGTMSGTLALDNADSLSFESGKHWITYNDGEGNFNIRVGHKSDSSTNEVSTETGYVFHDEWSQTSGWREFNVSGTSITEGGDVGTWRRQMFYDYNDVRLSYQGGLRLQTTSAGVTVSGNIAATNFSGSSSGTNTGDQDLSGYSTASGVADNADVTPSWIPANDPSYLTSVPSEYLTQTEGDARYPRGRTISYTSVDTDSDDDAWYKIFRTTDSGSTPVECHVRGYAHSSISFIVSEGYLGGSAHVQVLDYCLSTNNNYKWIKGVRIISNGDVELLLQGGSTVSLEMTIIGDATPVSQPELSSAANNTVKDTVVNPTTGMLRTYGNITGANLSGTNTGDQTLPTLSSLGAAPLDSPALTGTPTAPTAASTTNTTQLATTAFVSTAIANLSDSAPATLNTLNELAAALGDDASFSTTVTNSIATKLPLAGGTVTGGITMSSTSTSPKLDMTGHAGASAYNYFLRAANDGGNKAVHFVNGSTRTADGGANAYTIRNDGGQLILGHNSYTTRLAGSVINTAADVEITQSDTSNHWALKISTNGSNNSGFWTTNEDVRLLLRDNSGNIRVDLYPDSTSRFYDSVQFDSTITHNGVDLTSGTSVDQITEFPMTFQLEGNTWTDTGIDGTDLSTGTYTMQVYVSDFSVGGQHYYEYYSATISWYSGSTNSTVVDEIPVHRAGHAPNAGDLQFRTQRASGTDSHDLMLQVKTNSAYTGELDNSSGGKIMRFKFRRLM